MHKGFLQTAALLGALAVALGAFGAHGLKKIVPPETVASYQTGVQYQMYHAFALLIVGILSERMSRSLMNWSGAFFVLGIVLFSGSLYLLASLKAMNKVGVSGIGIITPIGGLMFLAGWIFLLTAIIKK